MIKVTRGDFRTVEKFPACHHFKLDDATGRLFLRKERNGQALVVFSEGTWAKVEVESEEEER